MTELPIQRLRDDAVVPTQAYPGDAGLDLSASERVELGPGERAVVGTGLAVAIPEGHAGYVQPRSGLAAKHGITILNAPGLIDAGYRGELTCAVVNMDRERSVRISRGQRIAQLMIVPVHAATPVLVEELPPSVRGERGFGSTGP